MGQGQQGSLGLAKDKKIRMPLYLTPAQKQYLERESEARGIAQNAVIQELINREMRREK